MDDTALNDLIVGNLSSVMAERGLTPSAWARAAGLSHTAVRDIISTKVKNPTYRVLVALAEAAGVDVRRITVGPHYLSADRDDAEALDLLAQLEPPERAFLLRAAKAQIAARAQPLQRSPEGDER
jgi:transcriptional regulator with XRE-family HTH domain